MKTISILALLALSFPLHAQKKPLDHSVYDGWQSVQNAAISRSGNILTWQENPQEGDGVLVIRNNKNGRQLRLPRGYKQQIVSGEQFVVCQLKPLYEQTRKAKIKKKKDDDLPQDSLAIVNLRTWRVSKFASVPSYKLGKYAARAVAFMSSDTTLIPKKERKKKDVGRPMLVYEFLTGRTDTLRHVDAYDMDRTGSVIAYTRKEQKNKMLLGTYDIARHESALVGDTLAFYSLPSFNEQGSQMLYLASADTMKTGNKHCSLYRYTMNGKAERLVDSARIGNLPKGWGINEYAAPSFSRDGKRIFAGVAPLIAPDDTTKYDFETAQLDLWTYNEPMLPPAMKVNLKRLQRQTCLAVYRGGALQPLTTSMFDDVRLINRGNAPKALSVDRTERMVETQWNYQIPERVSLIDLSTGTRQLVTESVVERVTASPSARYVAYFDMKASVWKVFDSTTSTTRELGTQTGVNFWDEDDDHPMLKEPYGLAGWTAGDADIIVYDRYDVWRLPVNGAKAVCLTRGEGRRDSLTYRYINTKEADDEPFIAPGEEMLLSVFDNVSKRNGLALTTTGGNLRRCTLEEWSYQNIIKAHDARVYAYLRGNFQHPNDIYLTRNSFKTQQQLSAINPQQKDYNWGSVELVHWTAYDGKRLDGLLYKPENFDPTKKYPVMIYFYEKRSESLYSYIAPAPSRSIINISFFTSRGYLCFVPDIVYTAGLPGESAYNCVVSGAEALARNPWVDRANMAIQGQSWGGYQVAYLITRTNMFKAAGAGAPVSNMTSAFGGIRWESGQSRQGQYEQGQSRIGRNLWQAPELYLSNSALFRLPQVETPVLIMHNDADGAVPWYQGIELFMGLRRLGKPAWLLEYNNEAHNLKERRNCKDLSVRLQQFFDYELKGAPQPAWMKNGIPTLLKGQYFGFEQAD